MKHRMDILFEGKHKYDKYDQKKSTRMLKKKKDL